MQLSKSRLLFATSIEWVSITTSTRTTLPIRSISVGVTSNNSPGNIETMATRRQSRSPVECPLSSPLIYPSNKYLRFTSSTDKIRSINFRWTSAGPLTNRFKPRLMRTECGDVRPSLRTTEGAIDKTVPGQMDEIRLPGACSELHPCEGVRTGQN